MLKGLHKEIVETGICYLIEDKINKKWSLTSAKKILTLLDIAKGFKINLGFEDYREDLEIFLESKRNKGL